MSHSPLAEPAISSRRGRRWDARRQFRRCRHMRGLRRLRVRPIPSDRCAVDVAVRCAGDALTNRSSNAFHPWCCHLERLMPSPQPSSHRCPPPASIPLLTCHSQDVATLFAAHGRQDRRRLRTKPATHLRSASPMAHSRCCHLECATAWASRALIAG